MRIQKISFKKLSWLILSALWLSACSSVQTHQVDKQAGAEVYLLKDGYNEPPTTFKSYALSSKADSLCPSGYDILDRNIVKMAELGYDAAQCAVGGCDYQLQWKIQCSKKVQKSFSLFGKF